MDHDSRHEYCWQREEGLHHWEKDFPKEEDPLWINGKLNMH